MRNENENGWVDRVAGKVLTPEGILLLSAFAIFAALLFAGCDATAGALAMGVIPGVAGGRHLKEEPLTVAVTRREVPDLLTNEIDQRIVHIRPMATPIDQLSRWAGAKRAKSMVVDYYSVDTRPTSTVTTEEYTGPGEGEDGNLRYQRVRLKTDRPDIFDASETILVRGIRGYKDDGVTEDSQDLVLYVVGKDESSGDTEMVAVNGRTIGEFTNCIPTIPVGTMLVRMGRAASELDVQTAQFEALPVKSQNFCQIFKMQIEQSTLQKIAGKEVDWSFSDQEEAAIYDMRLGMEKNFLFGVKCRVADYKKHEDILLTGGIWRQAGGEFSYTKGTLDQNAVISMMRKAFTGNAGNKRKVLVGGSGLIEQLNKLDSTKMVSAGETVVKWGIDFTEMRSKFGKLYVLLSEVFDECGMEDNGMIIDPEYLQKYSHIPFSTESLSLKSAGVRNTDAIVLTEASCMTLRYPKAHLRIVCRG